MRRKLKRKIDIDRMKCSKKPPGHLCLFCLRKFDYNDNDIENTESVLNTFFEVIPRTAMSKNEGGNDLKSTQKVKEFLFPFAAKENESDLSVCKDCLVQFKIVCDLHTEIKMLEMKLDWRMWTICKVMTCAERVPYRKKDYLECLQKKNSTLGDGDSDVLSSFRKMFIRNCNAQRNGRFPLVRLKDCAAPRKSVGSNVPSHRRAEENPPASPSNFDGERYPLRRRLVAEAEDLKSASSTCSSTGAISVAENETLSISDHEVEEMDLSDIQEVPEIRTETAQENDVPLVTVEPNEGEVNLSTNLKEEGQVQTKPGTGTRYIIRKLYYRRKRSNGKPTYYCRLCKTRVANISTHKHNIRKEVPVKKKKIECQHCAQTFIDKWNQRRHTVRKHLSTFFSDKKSEQISEDEFCTHVTNFIEELLTSCCNTSEDTYSCQFCRWNGKKRNEFCFHLLGDRHLKAIRFKFELYMNKINLPKRENVALPIAKYKCKSCDEVMSDEWKLRRHVVFNHVTSFFSDLKPPEYTQEAFNACAVTFFRKIVDSSRVASSDTFHCGICKGDFRNWANFRFHLFKDDEHIAEMHSKFGQYIRTNLQAQPTKVEREMEMESDLPDL